MTKYLVVYQAEVVYKDKTLAKCYYKEEGNKFFFFERLPIYSVIVEKLMKELKKDNYISFNLIILGIYPLEKEPTDIEGKEVIKL